MALRATRYLRSMLNVMGERRSFASSTTPRFSPATIHHTEVESVSKSRGADYAPIYMIGGFVMVALSLGTITAKNQLVHSPGVKVNKRKRQSIPEVDDPHTIAKEGGKFIDISRTRAVAMIQKPHESLRNYHQNPYIRSGKVESIK